MSGRPCTHALSVLCGLVETHGTAPFHKVGNRLVSDLADLDAVVGRGRVERAAEIIPNGSVSRNRRR
jgi:hypothetical protein